MILTKKYSILFSVITIDKKNYEMVINRNYSKRIKIYKVKKKVSVTIEKQLQNSLNNSEINKKNYYFLTTLITFL